MLKALIVLHRYLGVLVGLVMLVWCLSGFVMMYQSFPGTTEEERLAGLEQLELSNCCALDDIGLGEADPVRGFRLEMAGGAPVLQVDGGEGPQRFDARTGAALDGFGEEAVRAAALGFASAKGVAGDLAALEPIRRDQWSVASWKRQAPIWRATFNDPNQTYVYVSGKTGQVFQDANAGERLLSWFGAIPHWLYPTLLRENQPVWSQVVIWSSTIGVFLTVTGLVVGFVRLRGRSGKWWPYRRPMWLWHHMFGVFGGVLVLTWTASGLLTMQPWGLLESRPGVTRADVTGAMSWGEARALIESVKRETEAREVVQARAAPMLGAPYAAMTLRDGSRLRVGLEGVAELSAHELAAHLVNIEGPLKGARLEVLAKEDAYYYAHHAKVALPVLRLTLNDKDRSRVYLEPVTGEVVRVADATAKRYRWFENAFHNFDWPVLRARPLWDVIVILSLAAMSVVCATGAWLSFTRIGRDAGLLRDAARRLARAKALHAQSEAEAG